MTKSGCQRRILPVVYYGEFETGLSEHGDERRLHCYPGYRISGPSFTRCHYGMWTPPGLCVPVDSCHDLPLPVVINGIVDSGDSNLGDTRQIFCATGFVKNEPSFTKCGPNGWSTPGQCVSEGN